MGRAPHPRHPVGLEEHLDIAGALAVEGHQHALAPRVGRNAPLDELGAGVGAPHRGQLLDATGGGPRHILGIQTLDGIQWTPGSGNKPFIEWMDLLKRMQGAGKCLYIPCSLAELPAYHRELRPEGVFYATSAPSVKLAVQPALASA